MTQTHAGALAQQPPIGGAKVIVAALSLGVIAVLILSFYIQSVKNQVAAQQFTVFVLKRSIKPGDPMKATDWERVSVPDKSVFRDGFKGLNAYISDSGSDEALKAEIAGGKQWEITADAGAVITHAFLTKPPERRDKAIEDGKVRIALPIKSKMAPGGLRPGDKVDIAAPILTGGQVPEVMVVLNNIEVKAVGNYTLSEESSGNAAKTIRSFNSVSVDVDQETAVMLSTLEKMVAAVGEFELYLVPEGTSFVPKWDPGKINPAVMTHIRKNLPARVAG